MNVSNKLLNRETVYISCDDSYGHCEFVQCIVFVDDYSLVTECQFTNCVIVGNIDLIYFNTFEGCK